MQIRGEEAFYTSTDYLASPDEQELSWPACFYPSQSTKMGQGGSRLPVKHLEMWAWEGLENGQAWSIRVGARRRLD